jgi:biopolymer transport protein ExbD
MRTVFTLQCLFLLVVVSANAETNQSCDVTHLVHLQVARSGTVIWDGIPLRNRKELIEKFKASASTKPQQAISLVPGMHTKYKTVASILHDAQSVGMHCIGFTAMERYVQ